MQSGEHGECKKRDSTTSATSNSQQQSANNTRITYACKKTASLSPHRRRSESSNGQDTEMRHQQKKDNRLANPPHPIPHPTPFKDVLQTFETTHRVTRSIVPRVRLSHLPVLAPLNRSHPLVSRPHRLPTSLLAQPVRQPALRRVALCPRLALRARETVHYQPDAAVRTTSPRPALARKAADRCARSKALGALG